MTDREKVIKGMECCFTDMDRSDSMPCRSCPYGTLPKDMNCQKKMFAHVLALLKEQEAVAPELEVLNELDRLYRCPKCHKHFFYEKQKYCDQCGQAIKWD